MKICGIFISIGTLIGMVFGYFFWMESRYALAQQLEEEKKARQAVEQRLDYKIKSDQTKSQQSRLWQLQDRCQVQKPCDVTTKEEIRTLESELADSKKQLKVLEKNDLKR